MSQVRTRRDPARIGIAAGIWLTVLSGLGCQSIQVDVDFRRNFRFTSVRTWAWLPDPPGHAGDPVLHNDLVDGRVRRAVDRELRQMGYRRVAVEEADVHVTYYLSLDTEVSWQMVSRAYQYRGGFFEQHTTQTALRKVDRGTLLLDFLEPARRRLVWRGSARARVSRSWDAARRNQKIDDAVAKTLAQFPPGGPRFRPPPDSESDHHEDPISEWQSDHSGGST